MFFNYLVFSFLMILTLKGTVNVFTQRPQVFNVLLKTCLKKNKNKMIWEEEEEGGYYSGLRHMSDIFLVK